ncbi:hypothetical protein FRC18_000972 [Serendipita sp. 400]|nr:hypothetical protein FRC18_000972 [Serendipita sp. 400]
MNFVAVDRRIVQLFYKQISQIFYNEISPVIRPPTPSAHERTKTRQRKRALNLDQPVGPSRTPRANANTKSSLRCNLEHSRAYLSVRLFALWRLRRERRLANLKRFTQSWRSSLLSSSEVSASER